MMHSILQVLLYIVLVFGVIILRFDDVIKFGGDGYDLLLCDFMCVLYLT
jgi:hypothetical protein